MRQLSWMNGPQMPVLLNVILSALLPVVGCADMVLVDQGKSHVSIVVAPDTGEETRMAADTLIDMVEKISGARLQRWQQDQPLPTHAIWIGMQPKVRELFPDVNFQWQHPEEILIVCDGKNLALIGNDRRVGDVQVEFGTANAVYTFMQRQLDIRWLWPGELGIEIPAAKTIKISPVSDRFSPPIRERKMWHGSYSGKMKQDLEDWFRCNRQSLGSLRCHGGHAYMRWWEQYSETHPDYFALLPDATRQPQRDPKDVKLCVSNPRVWNQWLDNAEKELLADPSLRMVSASPNDGAGFCVCAKCRAWDNPDGPKMWGYVALTDRYVRYWNILARGLRERLPGREAFVGVYAYSAYRTPPVAEWLEPNIAVGYVGHFPLADDATTEQEKENWKGWADKSTLMFYRPNLFHYTGGWLSLPSVASRRAMQDFRFLAENKCVSLQVDTLPMNWATQGLMYYVLAQLAYDPLQDGPALLKDYYQRGFGPAALAVEAYFDLLENAHEQLLPQIKHSSGWALEAVAVYQRVYTDEVLDAAQTMLERAAEQASQGPGKYRDRIAFLRSGLDLVRLQVRIMHLMQRVRESHGKDTVAVQEANDLCMRREQVYEGAWPTFAFRPSRWYHDSRGMADYLGPPSKELLQQVQNKRVRLAPAKWAVAWSDDFDRAELGPDWRVVDGAWTIQDGCLVAKGGGKVLSTREFTGLQKVQFDVSVTANPGEVVSDLDPIIHSDDHGAGYLMQLGGYYNRQSSIQKKGNVFIKGEHTITPDRTYAIVAELDGNILRLSADGQTLLEHTDAAPLIDEDHRQIGFYSYQGIVKIERVTVYISKAITLDEPEGARE